jgi:cation transport regulator ChaC
VWIFGYGSLTWKVGFEYVERHPGYVEGWTRRFWQLSTDHRGVPQCPGRVVTLIPEPEQQTWGVAYRVHGEDRDEVLERLDFREKGGYERHFATVRRDDGLVIAEQALVYVATRDNPNWGGPAPTDEIARIIARSHGPSGPNIEYLLRLAQWLREIDALDEHVFELERAVRALEHSASDD